MLLYVVYLVFLYLMYFHAFYLFVVALRLFCRLLYPISACQLFTWRFLSDRAYILRRRDDGAGFKCRNYPNISWSSTFIHSEIIQIAVVGVCSWWHIDLKISKAKDRTKDALWLVSTERTTGDLIRTISIASYEVSCVLYICGSFQSGLTCVDNLRLSCFGETVWAYKGCFGKYVGWCYISDDFFFGFDMQHL